MNNTHRFLFYTLLTKSCYNKYSRTVVHSNSHRVQRKQTIRNCCLFGCKVRATWKWYRYKIDKWNVALIFCWELIYVGECEKVRNAEYNFKTWEKSAPLWERIITKVENCDWRGVNFLLLRYCNAIIGIFEVLIFRTWGRSGMSLYATHLLSSKAALSCILARSTLGVY